MLSVILQKRQHFFHVNLSVQHLYMFHLYLYRQHIFFDCLWGSLYMGALCYCFMVPASETQLQQKTLFTSSVVLRQRKKIKKHPAGALTVLLEQSMMKEDAEDGKYFFVL